MSESLTSIARNTRTMLSAQVITWASSFLLILFLPRYLGDEAFGKLYFGITVAGLMGLVIDLGLGSFFVKEVARDRRKAAMYLQNGSVLKLLAWVVTFAMAMAFVLLFGYPEETVTIVFILGFGKLLEGLADLFHRLFQSFEQLQYRSYAIIAEKVFLSASGVTLLLLGFGAQMIALLMVAGMGLNLLTGYIFSRRLVRLERAISRTEWPEMLRGGFPFLIALSVSFIYYRIDILILSSLTNDKVVGWYGAPYRLFDTLMFFPVLLQLAVFPVLSRLWDSSEDSLYRTARKVLDITFVVGVPLAIGMASFAREIVSILFGLEQYANSVILLQILSVSLVLVYVDFVISTVLMSSERQKHLPKIAVVATVINLTLNFLLIPYFDRKSQNGAIGAAISTALTEVAVMAMFTIFLPAGCFNRSNLAVAAKVIFCGLLMGASIVFVPRVWDNSIVAGVAGVAAYSLGLMLTRVFRRKELEFLLFVVRMKNASTLNPTGAGVNSNDNTEVG